MEEKDDQMIKSKDKNVSNIKADVSSEGVIKSATNTSSEKGALMSFLARLKNSSTGKLFAGLGIIASALVVAGGVYAYQNIYLAPERVLQRSIAAMEGVKSYEFDSVFSLAFESSEVGGSVMPLFLANALNVHINGNIDAANEENIKSDFDIEVKSGNTKYIKAHILGLGEDGYLNIEDLSGIESILDPERTGVFSFFVNKWISFDKESLRELGYDVSAAEQSKIDPQEISKIFSEHNPFMITQQYASEQLDGQDMFHYGFDMDKEKLKVLLKEIQEKFLDSGELGPNAADNLNSAVDKLLIKGGEIWIGKNDYYLRKFVLGLNQEGDDGSMGVDIAVNMKDYGKEVGIAPPVDAVTVPELLESFQTFFVAPSSDFAI